MTLKHPIRCPGPDGSDETCSTITARPNLYGVMTLTEDAAGFEWHGYRCKKHLKRPVEDRAPVVREPLPQRPHPSREVQMLARTERARAERKAAEQVAINRAVSATIAAARRRCESEEVA